MSGARRPSGEAGFTLVEMLTVMVLLGIVVGTITGLFVQATNAEVDMHDRFEAQMNARLALDRLRREVHCASSITPAGASTTVTLTLPTYCRVATGTFTWCAVPYNGSTSRYRLWRSSADPCGDGADRLYADFLTSSNVFTYTVQSSASRGKLSVDLPVDLEPAQPGSFRLQDDLVLRNSSRTCIAGSPSPPC